MGRLEPATWSLTALSLPTGAPGDSVIFGVVLLGMGSLGISAACRQILPHSSRARGCLDFLILAGLSQPIKCC